MPILGVSGVYGGDSDFEPIADTSPTGWWNAEDCAEVGEGTNIGTWTDASGNGWTLTNYGEMTATYRGSTWAAGVHCIDTTGGGGSDFLYTADTGIQAEGGTAASLFVAAKPASGDALWVFTGANATTFGQIAISKMDAADPTDIDVEYAGASGGDAPSIADPFRLTISDNVLYVNGTNRDDPIGNGTFSGDGAHYFVAYANGLAQFYIGCIGYWNRALTSTEIANLETWAKEQGWT